LVDWLDAEGATVGCSQLVQSLRVSHPRPADEGQRWKNSWLPFSP
jgi:hypothetical protein